MSQTDVNKHYMNMVKGILPVKNNYNLSSLNLISPVEQALIMAREKVHNKDGKVISLKHSVTKPRGKSKTMKTNKKKLSKKTAKSGVVKSRKIKKKSNKNVRSSKSISVTKSKDIFG